MSGSPPPPSPPPPSPAVVARVAALARRGAGVEQQRTVISRALERDDPMDVARLLDRMAAGDPDTGAGPDEAAARRCTPDGLAEAGIRVTVPGAAGYPPALLRAWPELGAPLWLFVTGEGADERHDAPAVAVVGTRHPTAGGLRLAERIGAELAAVGAVVVSGMARGIDQAAHRGALSVGGATRGVLGTGFGVDYPRGSGALRRAVAASGGLFSELAPGTPPRPWHFLARNRIISGLCDATVVVEGRARSGALHTARMAGSQGRDVWAVPGPPDAPVSQAPLALIRDGAQVVTRIADLVEALGLSRRERDLPRGQPPTRRSASESLDAAERQVLALLGPAPTEVDDLVTRTGLTVPVVLRALARLQRRGLARDGPRGVVAA